eukprot:gnl/TRDRNA2_/TRDRNA2_94761_c0_seq1.p2 gnl/TRDRNA2_/TRDRNA2_94761_c0~~gnl/TRDRNA2_/TRDRNA2_94761_c0_seq1.p2  ORF type:complete len:150 (-),score=29.53 gnl/TRDRNA2_/TRDRNA2_94761_c0_seq1:26-475(-)
MIGELSCLLEADPGRIFRTEELAAAATERRRGLEETLLWAAWSEAAPEGANFLTRSDLVKVLESAGPAFRRALGDATADALQQDSLSSKGNASGATDAGYDQVSFDDLLSRLRNVVPMPEARWLRPASSGATKQDLQLRMPPPQATDQP